MRSMPRAVRARWMSVIQRQLRMPKRRAHRCLPRGLVGLLGALTLQAGAVELRLATVNTRHMLSLRRLKPQRKRDHSGGEAQRAVQRKMREASCLKD